MQARTSTSTRTWKWDRWLVADGWWLVAAAIICRLVCASYMHVLLLIFTFRPQFVTQTCQLTQIPAMLIELLCGRPLEGLSVEGYRFLREADCVRLSALAVNLAHDRGPASGRRGAPTSRRISLRSGCPAGRRVFLHVGSHQSRRGPRYGEGLAVPVWAARAKNTSSVRPSGLWPLPRGRDERLHLREVRPAGGRRTRQSAGRFRPTVHIVNPDAGQHDPIAGAFGLEWER